MVGHALFLACRFVVGMPQHPVVDDADLFVSNRVRRPRPRHDFIVGLLPIRSIQGLKVQPGLNPELHMLRHQLQQTGFPQRLNQIFTLHAYLPKSRFEQK